MDFLKKYFSKILVLLSLALVILFITFLTDENPAYLNILKSTFEIALLILSYEIGVLVYGATINNQLDELSENYNFLVKDEWKILQKFYPEEWSRINMKLEKAGKGKSGEKCLTAYNKALDKEKNRLRKKGILAFREQKEFFSLYFLKDDLNTLTGTLIVNLVVYIVISAVILVLITKLLF